MDVHPREWPQQLHKEETTNPSWLQVPGVATWEMRQLRIDGSKQRAGGGVTSDVSKL